MFALLTLLGCFESPFEGTWLFMVNLNTEYTGDCASDSDVTYTGTSNDWVDIYKATDGQMVVLLDEALVGEPKGNDLTATWTYTESSDSYSDTEVETLVASYKNGELHGNFTTESSVVSGSDTYDCTAATPYIATRSTSNPDHYVAQ